VAKETHNQIKGWFTKNSLQRLNLELTIELAAFLKDFWLQEDVIDGYEDYVDSFVALGGGPGREG